MTNTTTTISVKQGIGGYRGKMRERAWIARITGTDEQYGLERDFLDAVKVERDSFTKTKYIRTYRYSLTPGLYETSQYGDREFVLVEEIDGVATARSISEDDAKKMAAAMSAEQSS